MTKSKFDCMGEGCGECKICKYIDFLDWSSSVAPAGSTIERNPELDKYLKEKELERERSF